MVANKSPTPEPEPPDVSALCLAVTEHSPLPIATVDGATHIIRYANPAFCTMMGQTSAQIVGKPLCQLLPEKDQCVRLLDRVYHHRRPESFTEKEETKPHPVFWSYTMWPVLADKLLVGVMIQVTETAQSHGMTVAMNEALMLGSIHQHELAAAAERLNLQLQEEISARQEVEMELAEKARLVNLSNDAIIVYDLNDKITLWNKGAEHLYGWSSQEAVGQHVHSLLRTEFPKPLTELVALLNKNGQLIGEVVQIARDGHRIPSLSRWVLDRPTKSILASYTDISDRKHFEEEREIHLLHEHTLRMEAESANRSKDLFLATLSHEVRTPLNAILGWATILRSGKCNEADLKEGMEVIERNCNVQAKLIEDVLDISRIVSGKLQLHIAPVELLDIIHAAIDVVRPSADAKNIRILSTLDPAASHVHCDAARLQQVLWNLLANAVKFSPPGKTIHVTLGLQLTSARIQISDEGQGLAPDFLPFVFDRFRQADSTSKRKIGGLGLGLSIVKHLVEIHGGTVLAESPGEGRGSTFTVTLPIRAVPVDQLPDAPHRPAFSSSLPEPEPVHLDGLRVLVVDDEPDVRRLLLKVLGGAGAIVTAAASVTEALDALPTTNPQILVSDIAMPTHDGYDLIRQVRSQGLTAKDLPAIALTAFAHKDDRRRTLLAGFQVHVPKPVDPHDLTALIASLAGRTG